MTSFKKIIAIAAILTATANFSFAQSTIPNSNPTPNPDLPRSTPTPDPLHPDRINQTRTDTAMSGMGPSHNSGMVHDTTHYRSNGSTYPNRNRSGVVPPHTGKENSMRRDSTGRKNIMDNNRRNNPAGAPRDTTK